MTTRIRALIVDDEGLARKGIRSLLAKEDDFHILGECENGVDAVRRIREDPPDIVFLDIQMPELDGFGVVEAIGAEKMPVTIFVTAYDEYAVKAFDANALDYLLKPFDRPRFSRAVMRAREHVRVRMNGTVDVQLLSLLRQINARSQYVDRLLVKSGPRVVFLKAQEIDWIEAAGNYVRLHSGADSHLLHETMSHLEARLDPQVFVRIHRSSIVNLERIREMRPAFHGDYTVVLRDGTQLTASRTYRNRLQAPEDESE